jgi:hypothetical protein
MQTGICVRNGSTIMIRSFGFYGIALGKCVRPQSVPNGREFIQELNTPFVIAAPPFALFHVGGVAVFSSIGSIDFEMIWTLPSGSLTARS